MSLSCHFRRTKRIWHRLDFRTMEVQGCHCETIPQRLVVHGLFPTSPNQPRMAISIDLLNFYHTLFEESCDAIHAMSHALKKFYTRRGYILASQHTVSIRVGSVGFFFLLRTSIRETKLRSHSAEALVMHCNGTTASACS